MELMMKKTGHCRRWCEDAEIVVLERGARVSFANCGLP